MFACYVLIENRSQSSLLGDRSRGQAESANATWTLLVDQHFAFGDADPELRRWSTGTRVARLHVLEDFAHATAWTDGNLDWEISYEAELDNFPLTSHAFPYDLATLVPTEDPGAWLQAPAAAIQRLTNWHPG
ncbi:hypothetical protein GCM10010435_72820 [Winogradskya consettensis]|uniref:Uncharacterized protein n=1 Tax=Winogradskya consettensis TaxID=113560 RepID=A0A919SND6_9ACTN|nr:hypothetical protein [Actinoplanes consettensis]GIM75305.1 hypothetical protein Aco04nite_44760 [Actinoplanes consettensis]